MINQDDIYKFVGFSIIVLIAVLFFLKCLNFQSKIIEGYVSSPSRTPTEVSETVKNNSSKSQDTLLVSKYRSNYEDIIIDLESHISSTMISQIVNNADAISSNPTSETSKNSISYINNLNNFINSLETAMTKLDKKT